MDNYITLLLSGGYSPVRHTPLEWGLTRKTCLWFPIRMGEGVAWTLKGHMLDFELPDHLAHFRRHLADRSGVTTYDSRGERAWQDWECGNRGGLLSGDRLKGASIELSSLLTPVAVRISPEKNKTAKPDEVLLRRNGDNLLIRVNRAYYDYWLARHPDGVFYGNGDMPISIRNQDGDRTGLLMPMMMSNTLRADIENELWHLHKDFRVQEGG